MMRKSIELRDESSLSQEAYLELCNKLFSEWARHSKSKAVQWKNFARKCRGLLSVVHRLYRDDQACPAYYAKEVTKQAEIYIGQAKRF